MFCLTLTLWGKEEGRKRIKGVYSVGTGENLCREIVSECKQKKWLKMKRAIIYDLKSTKLRAISN